MKQYQKIATLVMRLVSTLVFLFGTAYFTTLITRRFMSDESEYYTSVFSPTDKVLMANGFQYIIIAVAIFFLSSTIAKFVTRGLGD